MELGCVVRYDGAHFSEKIMRKFPTAASTVFGYSVARSAFVVMAVLSVPARAGTCPSSPSNWAAENCVVNGHTICTWTSATGVVACTVAWSTGDTQIVAVTDWDDTNEWVQVWGNATYTSGGSTYNELFCCPGLAPSSGSTPNDIQITGSNHSDDLRFTWTYGGIAYSQYQAPDDHAYAGGAVDTITGSLSPNTSDHLYGEGHHDTINALDGNDFLYGGDGSDNMAGGPGMDYMEGNADSDTMTGGDGQDEMLGGDERDYMNGNLGDDVMDGGNGPDVLCGGGEDTGNMYDDVISDGDSVSEGAGGDLIWASQVGDTAICDGDNTKWDYVADGPGQTCDRTTNQRYYLPGGATMPPNCP